MDSGPFFASFHHALLVVQENIAHHAAVQLRETRIVRNVSHRPGGKFKFICGNQNNLNKHIRPDINLFMACFLCLANFFF